MPSIDTAQLRTHLEKTRVLVIGDVMLDCYFWGEVSRVSPEAPVPVVKVGHKTWSLGGAGNVAANLAGLGCQPALIGITGGDRAADRLEALLAETGIENLTISDGARPTITKTRVMAQRQQIVRLDEEDSRPIETDMQSRLLDSLNREIPRCRAIILSDYGKGTFRSPAFTAEVIRLGRKAGLPVLVDPKGTHWQRYAGATCITPNTAELERVLGERLESDSDLLQKASALRSDLSLEWLLVTRGPKGMGVFGQQLAPVLLPANAREVFDVSGAGDTVIATLAACIATGMPLPEAAEAANLAAGVVVGKLGTQPILWGELERTLMVANGCGTAFPASKVADRTAAAAILETWREKGEKIVFTNGCFDLLHPGHISLLHQARRLGDRLVVGLNTDSSIKRLKGEARPILPGTDRAAILSALEDVNLIVFFDEDTPLTLIDSLRPDILVKGADYRVEEVVGRQIVESYGGQVRLVKILEGHSTTRIVQKLSES